MLDLINRRILAELVENGRIPFRELGERVGLSGPAVTERVRRLEREGVITGYSALINPVAFGYPILAIVRISHSPGRPPDEASRLAADMPEVIECNRVTGSESYVVRAWCRDLAHLNDLVLRFSDCGETTTNLVIDTPVERRSLQLDG
jgi:Lrp/AsnC family transcriptional regulator, leucine-responsive regulatory protein